MFNSFVCSTDCSGVEVGLTNKTRFGDSLFTATSTYDNFYAPHKSRFDSNRCWEPTNNNVASDYLQIDLGTSYKICAVATKGSGKPGYSEWMTKYKLWFSLDNVKWNVYEERCNVKVTSYLHVHLLGTE